MALRIEAGIILFLFAGAQGAELRHHHSGGGGDGALSVTDSAIVFEEPGKPEHSRTWKYTDIQQLLLSESGLRVLTYEDRMWALPGDREYAFDALPEGFAREIYPTLRAHLDQRFVVAFGDTENARWTIPVKLPQRFGGTQGMLSFTGDRLTYVTEARSQSRTWRIDDIDNVSSSSPFELSISTYEKTGWQKSATRVVQFQLKERLAEDRYNDLWRRVNQAKGLQILQSKGE